MPSRFQRYKIIAHSEPQTIDELRQLLTIKNQELEALQKKHTGEKALWLNNVAAWEQKQAEYQHQIECLDADICSQNRVNSLLNDLKARMMSLRQALTSIVRTPRITSHSKRVDIFFETVGDFFKTYGFQTTIYTQCYGGYWRDGYYRHIHDIFDVPVIPYMKINADGNPVQHLDFESGFKPVRNHEGHIVEYRYLKPDDIFTRLFTWKVDRSRLLAQLPQIEPILKLFFLNPEEYYLKPKYDYYFMVKLITNSEFDEKELDSPLRYHDIVSTIPEIKTRLKEFFSNPNERDMFFDTDKTQAYLRQIFTDEQDIRIQAKIRLLWDKTHLWRKQLGDFIKQFSSILDENQQSIFHELVNDKIMQRNLINIFRLSFYANNVEFTSPDNRGRKSMFAALHGENRTFAIKCDERDSRKDSEIFFMDKLFAVIIWEQINTIYQELSARKSLSDKTNIQKHFQKQLQNSNEMLEALNEELNAKNEQIEAQKLELEIAKKKLEEQNIKLKELAEKDGLTSLLQKNALYRIFSTTLANLIARGTIIYSLAMFDIDKFKRVNDIFGHIYGDKILIYVAEKTKKAFQRGTDYTVRFGGEEFIVMSNNGVTETLKKMQELQQTMKMEMFSHKSDIPLYPMNGELNVVAIIFNTVNWVLEFGNKEEIFEMDQQVNLKMINLEMLNKAFMKYGIHFEEFDRKDEITEKIIELMIKTKNEDPLLFDDKDNFLKYIVKEIRNRKYKNIPVAIEKTITISGGVVPVLINPADITSKMKESEDYSPLLDRCIGQADALLMSSKQSGRDKILVQTEEESV